MNDKLRYRLITGPDDSTFCERISKLLNEGYELYGSPSISFNGKDTIAAQAVVLKARKEKDFNAQGNAKKLGNIPDNQSRHRNRYRPPMSPPMRRTSNKPR